MPFGRRNKKKDFLNLRNIFNNLLNFSRTRKYISLSIKRMRASPNELALGLACGIAISFTPFIGLHALLSIFFAWVVRGSMAAALIGTLVGNPWTFPFIWMWLHQVGNWMGATGASSSPDELDFGMIFSHMINGVLMGDTDYLIETIWPVWWPMMVGAIPSMLVVWFGSYLPLKSLIQSYHVARRKRMGGKSRKNKKG